MWTEISRPQYERCDRRYASDLLDEEWNLIMPLLPPVKRLGWPRRADMREVLNIPLHGAHGQRHVWTPPVMQGKN